MGEQRYLRATVEYDGTAYCGFQVQKGQPTVQGTLEQALKQVTGETIRLVAAGRTDSGVHALGQVVAFYTHWRHTPQDLQRAWNAALPMDIAVRDVEVAPEGFHPRYSALSRVYRYTILNRVERSPLLRRTSWHVPKPLDLEAMAEATALVVGEHDFATFGQPPQGTNTVRRVLRAEWKREGALLHFEIEANAFLYQMVRSLVGTLVWVGWGKWGVEDFAAALAACDRSRSGPTAPPHGLCLIEVLYPPSLGGG